MFIHTTRSALRAITVTAVATLVAAASTFSAPTSAHAATQDVYTPVADTYVSRSEPAMAHGSLPFAYGSGADNQAFLKFNTAGVVSGGQTITSITLRLYVVESLNTDPRVEVHPASSAWTESALTMNTRPAFQGSVYSAFVTPSQGHWMDIPLQVSGALDINGPSSFEVKATVDGTAFRFATRESSEAPQLVITKTGGTTLQSSSNADLPFARSTDNPRGKLVFAHYFTPYPVSLDNESSDVDYYARNYLVPQGENGKFSAYGGLLRDRPAGRAPISGDYSTIDLQNEVAHARSAGIDGFTLDLLWPSGLDWDRAMHLMDAAHASDPTFKIMAMPDMGSLGSITEESMESMLTAFAAKPSAYHLADGRLVVAPFAAEARSTQWWADVTTALAKAGINVALVPTFVNFPVDLAPWENISYGLSTWGGRSPSNIYSTYGKTAHKDGKIWMQAVAVQDERPTGAMYDEAEGLATLRQSWAAVNDTDADWVQLTTWNDFSEGTAFSPSANHGWCFLDVDSYYLQGFKSGTMPAIQRNALYVVHRKQFASATPSYPQSVLMQLRSNSVAAVDIVEVTSFLTSAATVSASVGGVTTSWSAPAGYSTHSVPLRAGSVSVAAVDTSGKQLASVNSPFQVSSTPYTQDLQYTCTGSLR